MSYKHSSHTVVSLLVALIIRTPIGRTLGF